MNKRFVIGVSGASGSIYARETCRALLNAGAQVYLVFSTVARQVWLHELGSSVNDFINDLPTEQHAQLTLENNNDLAASIASGSFRHDGMIISPCSMKCLAAVANGFAGTLIERAADVSLKERFPLILLTRETPLNLIHIENMAQATRAGAIILPASPGFYHGDNTFEGLVNFVVGKSLDMLGITDHKLFTRWKDEGQKNA